VRSLQCQTLSLITGDRFPVLWAEDYTITLLKRHETPRLCSIKISFFPETGFPGCRREALEDAARLIGASLAERHARFRQQRAEFEACAEDVLRSQAPDIDRVIIDTMTFDAWRQRRRGKLVVQGG